MSDDTTPAGQLLIFSDGTLNLQVRFDGKAVWLTQSQMAELYQTTKQNTSLHVQNILDYEELPTEAVVKEYLTTVADEHRESVFPGERRSVSATWEPLTPRPSPAKPGEGSRDEDTSRSRRDARLETTARPHPNPPP